MKPEPHPAVVILKEIIHDNGFQYEVIAASTGISIHRFKNLMTGRTDMTLKERDAICHVLGVTPHEVVMLRKDPNYKKMQTDLDHLPPDIKKTILKLCKDLRGHYEFTNHFTRKV